MYVYSSRGQLRSDPRAMADARVCRRVGSLDDGQHKTNMDGKTHTHASIHSHSTQNTADLKSDKCARRSAQARKEPLRNGGEEATPPATTRCLHGICGPHGDDPSPPDRDGTAEQYSFINIIN